MVKNHINEKLSDLGSDLKSDALHLISNLSQDDLYTIERLVEQHEEASDLLELLGSESGAGAIGQNLLDAGRKLFLNINTKVQPIICGLNILKLYTNNTNVIDVITVSAIIAGSLTREMIPGINIPLISVIITRMGVRNFCSKMWDN